MNKEIVNSVARNTAIQFGQQVMTWVSGFALMIFLPRYLGPANFGRLYLAEMVAGMFVIAVAYDGKYGIARQVARNRDEAGDILVNSLAFRVVIWLVALVSMIIFSIWAEYPMPVVIMIAIFGVEMLWVAGRTVYSGVFLGFENTTYTAISAIAERFFVAGVGIIALVFFGSDEVGIAAIMAVGTLVNFIICAGYIRRILPPLPRVDWKKAGVLLHDGFPFLLWTIFGIVYYRIDAIMLSFYTPDQVVGWYGAAYKLFDVLVFLPSIFSLAILPVLSKLHGKEQMLLARTTQKGLNFILLTGIPISIVCFYYSMEIIGFLFGLKDYLPAAANLEIFAAGLLLLYIDMILATAIIACDKQRQLAWVAFIAVLINVGLNYFMIPYTQIHYGNGGIGAAVATLTTEFYVLISSIFILPKSIFDGSETGVWLKSALAGCGLYGFYMLVSSLAPGVYWMVTAGAGAFAYGLLLLAMKTFTREELAYARQFTSLSTLRETIGRGRRGQP